MLNMDRIEQNINIKAGKFKYFKLEITNGIYDPSSDLIVRVFGRPQDDPDVYISKVKIYYDFNFLYRNMDCPILRIKLNGFVLKLEKIHVQ